MKPALAVLFLFAALSVLVPAFAEEGPVDPRLELATVEVTDYEYRKAEAIYRGILADDPKNVKAMIGLARCLSGVGEHPAAAVLYRKVIELAPDKAAPHMGLGSLAIYVNRKDEAKRHFERAVELAPESGPAIAGLARVHIELKNVQTASELIDKAYALEPESESVLSVKAEYYFRTGSMTASAETLRKMLAIQPRNLEAHQRLANGFLEYRRDMYVPPPVPKKYARRVEAAAIKYRALDLKAAEKLFAKLDTPDAPDARPPFYLGLIELRRGRDRRAIAHLWRAVDREPGSFLFRNALCVAYRRKIDRQRAEYGGGADKTDRVKPLLAQFTEKDVRGTSQLVRGYQRLLPNEKAVVLRAVRPLSRFVPILVRAGVRHDILGFEEGMCEASERAWLVARRTHDGRCYAALRGVGGQHAATGIESVLFAGSLGYDTFAHELAHQVHIHGLSPKDGGEIKRLYQKAMREDRALDYYAATNEREYFAQGYEAFLAIAKSPFRHSLRRHTRAELKDRDPGLYEFLLRLTGTKDPDRSLKKLAPKIMTFYEWSGDEIETKRARSLYGPLLPAARPGEK
jgi:tetratricopeptide (TPR) repeat protein